MATITVTTASDSVNPSDGLISLREAIALATGAGDRITFASNLSIGSVQLTSRIAIGNANAFTIDGDLDDDGLADVTLLASAGHFLVGAASNVTFDGLIFEGSAGSGDDGSNGANGTNGANGANGADGDDALDGSGESGKDGEAGGSGGQGGDGAAGDAGGASGAVLNLGTLTVRNSVFDTIIATGGAGGNGGFGGNGGSAGNGGNGGVGSSFNSGDGGNGGFGGSGGDAGYGGSGGDGGKGGSAAPIVNAGFLTIQDSAFLGNQLTGGDGGSGGSGGSGGGSGGSGGNGGNGGNGSIDEGGIGGNGGDGGSGGSAGGDGFGGAGGDGGDAAGAILNLSGGTVVALGNLAAFGNAPNQGSGQLGTESFDGGGLGGSAGTAGFGGTGAFDGFDGTDGIPGTDNFGGFFPGIDGSFGASSNTILNYGFSSGVAFFDTIFTVSNTTPVINEGDTSQIRINRIGNLTGAVDVLVQISSVSNLEAYDFALGFVPTTMTVHFNSGSEFSTLPLGILEDSFSEGPASFTVTLLATTYGGIGAAKSVTQFIADDDQGTSGNDTLTGSTKNDLIEGFGGNDTINGMAGADTMDGGTGDDFYFIDNAGDTIVEAIGGGNDTAATNTIWTLNAGAEVELLRTTSNGGTAAINITGNEFAQSILGNAGANVLSDGGLGGNDTMTGLGGNDTYIVNNAGAIIVEGAGQGTNDRVAASLDFTLAADDDIELLTTTSSGSTKAINLTGNALAQTITGNAGANTLHTGGGAADILRGLGGDDLYRVFNSGDTVEEAVGAGTDRVMAAVSFALGAGQEVEVMTTNGSSGTSAINLTGNELAQSITGNNGANVLSDGGGAADTMAGLAGDDTYIVSNASAVILESAGQGANDKVAARVSFTLAADDDIEMLTTTSSSGTGAINLTGNALAQEIVGNNGANTLHIGNGAADVLRGLGGNDTYRVFNSADTVVELAGQGTADKVMAAVSFALDSGAEVEFLQTNGSAGTSNIALTGNEIAQTIMGNAGQNRIDGKGGADFLSGGSNTDTFVFSTALGGANIDVITDFLPGADTIELDQSIFSAIVQAPGTMLSGYFKANAAGVATDANDRVIYDTTDGRLLYDFDGSGAGAAVQFAMLTGAPGLAFSDFVVA